jgi:hypothetical protein
MEIKRSLNKYKARMLRMKKLLTSEKLLVTLMMMMKLAHLKNGNVIIMTKS